MLTIAGGILLAVLALWIIRAFAALLPILVLLALIGWLLQALGLAS